MCTRRQATARDWLDVASEPQRDRGVARTTRGLRHDRARGSANHAPCRRSPDRELAWRRRRAAVGRGANGGGAARTGPVVVALVQGQHPHAHARERRRQHARGGDALVQGAGLPVPGAERPQRAHARRRAVAAVRRAGALPARARRGSDRPRGRQAAARQRPQRGAPGRAAGRREHRGVAAADRRRHPRRVAACRTSTTPISAGRSRPTIWPGSSASACSRSTAAIRW